MLHITTHGKETKLENIPSISTSCLVNKNCALNMKKVDPITGEKSICASCFSNTYQKMRPSLKQALINNSVVLSNHIWNTLDLPLVNAAFFRLESFGDLINTIHLENYCRLAERNPSTSFSLWTKQTEITENYFDHRRKPKNLRLIYSSLFVNTREDIKTFKYAFQVFTVYTKKYVSANKIKINCGKSRCLTCQKCYTGKTKYINEIKK